MTVIEYFDKGEHVLCERKKAKNSHLPGKQTVLFRTKNPETMKMFRESKGI